MCSCVVPQVDSGQLQLIQLRRSRGIPKAPGAGSPSSPPPLAGLWSPGSCLCARALAWGSHPDKTRQIQTKPHIQPLLSLGPRAPFIPPTVNIQQGAVPQASVLGVHWLADVYFLRCICWSVYHFRAEDFAHLCMGPAFPTGLQTRSLPRAPHNDQVLTP